MILKVHSNRDNSMTLFQVLDRLLKDGKQIENMKPSKTLSYAFFP